MYKEESSSHVLIIPSWFPSKKNPVAGIFIQQQVRALREAGLKIGVLYFEENLFKNQSPQLYKEAEIWVCRSSGFIIPKRFRQFWYIWQKQWDKLFNYYCQQLGWPNIIHAHSFVGGAIAKFLSKKYNIPYIITEHYSGFITHQIPNHWMNQLSSIYDNAELIIAVSIPLKQILKNFTHTKINVVPNLVDTNIFWPSSTPPKMPPLKLITVGGLIERKNHVFLLNVMKQLPIQLEAILTIIGDGKLNTMLQQKAQKLGIQKQVCFKRTCSPEEISDIMRESHLFVFASKAETFGVVLIEAIASGLPIISTPCGIAEVLVDLGAGKIVKTEEEMANVIENYRVNNYAQALQHIIRLNYSPNRVAIKYLHIYNSILL